MFDNVGGVFENLNRSATDCNGIESYCVYWVLSALDLWHATGDDAMLAAYVPNINAKLEHAHDLFPNPEGLAFFG